jgi:hypothetical protein
VVEIADLSSRHRGSLKMAAKRILRTFILALPAVLVANSVLAQSSLVVLHKFAGTDGAQPYAKLVEGADGELYGTTTSLTNAAGVVVGSGTVFKIAKTGTLTTLHSFGNISPPSAGLVFGPDGNLYGTTGYDCGTPNYPVPSGASGTVFVMTPSGQDFSTLQSFATQPAGALMLASDGNFYGVTSDSVFMMTPGGTATSLHTFTTTEGTGLCKLAEAFPGVFFGTASAGGSYNVQNGPPGGGTLFQITSAGAVSVIQSFYPWFPGVGGDGPCLDAPGGSFPVGGMTLGPDGNYFGLLYCGPYNEGVGIVAGVYTLSSAGAYASSNIAAFAKNVDQPTGELTLGSDGRLYGVSQNNGTVFAMAADGTVTILYQFADGATPQGGVTEASDGRFYGATTSGYSGTGYGSVYQLTLPPAAPAGVKATASAGALTVTWNSVMTANSYDVFIGTAVGAESPTPSRTGITGTSISIDAVNGTTYFLKVAAVNSAGVGLMSAEVSAKPAAATPAAAPSSGGGGGSIDWLCLAGLMCVIAAGFSRRSRGVAAGTM